MISVNPPEFNQLFQKGLDAFHQGKHEESFVYFGRAKVLSPSNPDVYNGLGAACFCMGRFEEATNYLLYLLQLQPSHVEGLANLGAVYFRMNRLEAAEAYLMKAIALSPTYASARSNLGMTRLLQGRFLEAWKEYAYRTEANKLFKRPRYPEWHGEPLLGKKLLLVCEQGVGDQFQFIRYAEMLHREGAIVDALVMPAVVELMKTAPGIRTAFPRTGDPYDYWSFMLSVPGIIGTTLETIPSTVPYLQPNPALVLKWQDKLEKMAGSTKKIGFAYAGSPTNVNDRYRSIPLKMFINAMPNREEIQWFSIQKGDRETELEDKSLGISIHALGPDLNDFSDTAAVIQNLDLLISVDTSVVHLAGALGKPVWVLLPANPDWRWMLERKDSPWYPTMRLFRQTRLGEWGEPLEDVHAALLDYLQ